MQPPLKIYNTLSREKEVFTPLNPPYVGMYVCGPTVYSNVHLGNCRTFTTFDIVARYLEHLGYKVRYVRNITDVGHLVDDADEGEDKIAKKARLENLEPMEIVQQYTIDFRQVMEMLNNRPPSIEPTATGHIVEQIGMVQQLLEKGMAYEVNGSVYFDVEKYNAAFNGSYGELSGRKLDELLSGQRDLDGQEEKRNAVDFAIWKKASSGHIMRWPSPWGEGFPGWHLECSVMSGKYLGTTFDIHGGGMDLKFPHHECEIAQGTATHGKPPVRYWMHGNMLTINGARMGKSAGNAILPLELFTGNHPLLDRPYSPMTLRFFMLQTHYRSTMDLSTDALLAANKGYLKLINGLRLVKELAFEPTGAEANEKTVKQIEGIIDSVYRGMNDDFNTAVAIAGLFNLLKKINSIHLGQLAPSEIGEELFGKMKETYRAFVEDIFGLKEEKTDKWEVAVNALLNDYKEAKADKNYAKVDDLRAKFKEMGMTLKDMRDRVEWAYDES